MKRGAQVINLCAGGPRKKALRQRLVAAGPIVSQAEANYDAAGLRSKFFRIASHKKVGRVTAKEMEGIYKVHFARTGSLGRSVYDSLRASAVNAVCPLCGTRVVGTLDHYLPKSEFPSLAVTPLNLTPACADCNWKKRAYVARSAFEQLLHPYYDDCDGATWLKADVVLGPPHAATFKAIPPAHWPRMLQERLKAHFRFFDLAALYATCASAELVTASQLHRTVRARATDAEVLQLIHDQVASHSKSSINAWQTALYTALLNSQAYLSSLTGPI